MLEKKGFFFKLGERWSKPEITCLTLILIVLINLVGAIVFFTYFGVDFGPILWWCLLVFLCLTGKLRGI
jgi:hypothetical protein